MDAVILCSFMSVCVRGVLPMAAASLSPKTLRPSFCVPLGGLSELCLNLDQGSSGLECPRCLLAC